MNIKQMHYDFKKKFNKVDSQQNRNLLIPEIDWALNEAHHLYIKMVAKPRTKSYLGFELNQRTKDDIRTLVKNNQGFNIVDNIFTLPEDYLHFASAKVSMTKGTCEGKMARLKIQQHDDEFEESVFNKSSFEWREVNGVFFEGGIKLFTDGTFTNDRIFLSYIRKPKYVHNAEDFRNSSYMLPGIETPLTGSQDSELPEHTHSEIVDLAVLLVSGEIQASDYSVKYAKLGLNQLK